MKKQKYILGIFALLVASLLSCSTTNISKPETLLWEVKSDNTTIYLMGSIHFATEDFYPLNPKIEQSFAESDFLAVEFDINKANPFELMSVAFYNDGTTLKDKLDSLTYQKIKSKLENLGLTEMMILKMKPWFAALSAQITELTTGGFQADLGIDQYFLKKAKEKNMTILELESMQEQLNIFNEFEKFPNEFIEMTLKTLSDTVQNQNTIIEAYKKADLEALENYLKVDDTDEIAKKINFLMNDNRNFKMLNKIEDYIKENKKVFVVVGAAHLIGENGLVNLLEKTNKYKIKRY